ncbi:MAG: family 16 glycosylhydrolase [Caldilineaceae bacterium]|nr:family 16 glycosylhydrolase [Caldilineaceae bacterium]
MTAQLAYLNRHVVGRGNLLSTAAGLCMVIGPTTASAYTNAQLDDYHTLRRSDFLHRPPLTLSLRARFSHNAEQLRGTAGFGFWNDPFGMTGARRLTLPRALWFFFSSSPSNMALAFNVPGPGWKAATIDAWRWSFLLLAPTAPVAMPLMKIPALYRHLWPIGQRAIGVHETLLALDMTAWHRYAIEWTQHSVRFFVDDCLILHADQSPRGPLGLVIWKDNQAMSLTPSTIPRHQLVACDDEQWMEMADLQIV